MRIYFLSYKAAILKLNGLYVGGVDLFERHIEIDLSDSVLAEIVPGENLQSVNFFINEKLLLSPPDYMDVYLMDGEALIYIRQYGNKDAGIRVLGQTRFSGALFTLFSQGGVYLSAEGADCSVIPLPAAFAGAKFEEKILAGYPVLALSCKNALLLLSDRGKRIFMNRVESVTYGQTLDIETAFETCTSAKAVCSFSYDGESLALISSRTVETRPPERGILHFAFFECVLTRGDFSVYLDDGLKQKAEALGEYLGEFIGVTVPTEKFYAEHPDERAAGLVYPKAQNLFEVKYFSCEITKDGKISNIYPI